MVKFTRAYTRHAVYRMYQLGLEEKDILKIFALYDSDALVETLKYYKFVQKKIPKEYFYTKLNSLQGWTPVKSRAQIFKSMFVRQE